MYFAYQKQVITAFIYSKFGPGNPKKLHVNKKKLFEDVVYLFVQLRSICTKNKLTTAPQNIFFFANVKIVCGIPFGVSYYVFLFLYNTDYRFHLHIYDILRLALVLQYNMSITVDKDGKSC